jgi:hypothetical protein
VLFIVPRWSRTNYNLIGFYDIYKENESDIILLFCLDIQTDIQTGHHIQEYTVTVLKVMKLYIYYYIYSKMLCEASEKCYTLTLYLMLDVFT